MIHNKVAIGLGLIIVIPILLIAGPLFLMGYCAHNAFCWMVGIDPNLGD